LQLQPAGETTNLDAHPVLHCVCICTHSHWQAAWAHGNVTSSWWVGIVYMRLVEARYSVTEYPLLRMRCVQSSPALGMSSTCTVQPVCCGFFPVFDWAAVDWLGPPFCAERFTCPTFT
jgi:hypothetical protein